MLTKGHNAVGIWPKCQSYAGIINGFHMARHLSDAERWVASLRTSGPRPPSSHPISGPSHAPALLTL